jgi:hypothetical protein
MRFLVALRVEPVLVDEGFNSWKAAARAGTKSADSEAL